MRTQPHQFDDVMHLVNPNQQKIALHMTFQTAIILANEFVRLVFGGNGLFVFKHVQYNTQSLNLFGIMPITFVILTILSSRL